MKFIVNVILPVEPFNTLVRNGSVGEILGRIIEETKPDHIYFSEIEGCRGATMIVDLKEASDIPKISEPWFLNFEASCEFRIAMTPDDLQRADISKIGTKWYNVHLL